ncbi:MAG: hypothetical protein K0R15_2361 [Clostridiales bacterium]|jgi:V/A-type H+-transporting ATPase subunit C|nr:hypothetical protein [Clostridiales bacterium]
MASGLYSYGGVSTKVRAMKRRGLKSNDYKSIMQMKSPDDIVMYLKTLEGYRDIFKDIDENNIHRGEVELRIEAAMYVDYMKIYRFVDDEKRKFLDIFFTKFEINILKSLLRKIFDEQSVDYDLSLFKTFFENHSSFDIKILSKSKTLEDFVENLKGSEYYTVLAGISEETKNLFSYEMKLENYYYQKVWKLKDKYLKGNDYKVVESIIGQRIDVQNILWVYRNKKYYKIDNSVIYGYIIPISYKLSKKELSALVETDSIAEFLLQIDNSYYSGLFENLVGVSNDKISIDTQVSAYLLKQISSLARNNPYSIASIISYLNAKEVELSDIISMVEGVRYKLKPEMIERYVIGNKL